MTLKNENCLFSLLFTVKNDPDMFLTGFVESVNVETFIMKDNGRPCGLLHNSVRLCSVMRDGVRERGSLSPRASVLPARKHINDIRGVTVISGGFCSPKQVSSLSVIGE